MSETKKELEIEQCKSQMSDLKQEYSEDTYNFDLIMKECQNELNALRTQNTQIKSENQHKTAKNDRYIKQLQSDLASKNNDFNVLKKQVREQIKELNINIEMIEKEHKSKLLIADEKNEKLIQECQSRMKTVLGKKNAQNHRLKRLLEKTVTEYEKEKQQTQTMLNLRNEQLKELL